MTMKLTSLLTIVICLIASESARAQDMHETFLFSDSLWRTRAQVYDVVVEQSGRWRYSRNDSTTGTCYIRSDSTTFGPFKEAYGLGFGEGSAMFYRKDSARGRRDLPFYYAAPRAARIFGPLEGEVKNIICDPDQEHVAMRVERGDSVEFWMDGQLLSRQSKTRKLGVQDSRWCALTGSQRLYFLLRGDQFFLYLNGRCIDSSADEFLSLSIGKSGDYSYEKRYTEQSTEQSTDDTGVVSYVLCTADTTIGPFPYHLFLTRNRDGQFAYANYQAEHPSLVVNAKLYPDFRPSGLVHFAGASHWLCVSRGVDSTLLCVDGRVMRCPVTAVALSSIDTNGHYAVVGTRDSGLWRIRDGHMDEEPLGRLSGHARVLSLGADGNTIWVSASGDSVSIYENRRRRYVLKKALSDVLTLNAKSLESYRAQPRFDERAECLYVAGGDSAFFLFEGRLSPPLPLLFLPTDSSSWHSRYKVCVDAHDDCFAAIIGMGDRVQRLIVNNQIVRDLNGIHDVMQGSVHFDGHHLSFVGRTDSRYSVYELDLP